MNTGGLAQMTYNGFPQAGGIGAPSSGFASRGKAQQLKRLSLVSAPKAGPVNGHQREASTTRASRSHLLAGLRTAPRPANNTPTAAGFSQNSQGFNNATVSQLQGLDYGQMAHASMGTAFMPTTVSLSGQMYSMPEQVLAPPSAHYTGNEEHVDPTVLAQLMATEAFLVQRQQQLQQQLARLTAQGLANLSLAANGPTSQPNASAAMMTHTANYVQQLHSGISSTPVEVPGQPGLYMVYNPMTDQYGYFVDPSAQQAALANSPPPLTPAYSSSPPKASANAFRSQIASRRQGSPTSSHSSDGLASNAELSTQSLDGSFIQTASSENRHKKTSSMATNPTRNSMFVDASKSLGRVPGQPQTPVIGTFGPGQARAGEHPTRQPRGPPPMEVLLAKPTSKHEGSKNFATRTRRSAWHRIRRAGIERSFGGRPGSSGSMTPASESEFNLPAMSDSDTESLYAGASGKRSFGPLRGLGNNAIGSERKDFQGRHEPRRVPTPVSACSDDGLPSSLKYAGGALNQNRKAPLLILTTAEKRRSAFL